MATASQKKALDQFGDAGFFLAGELPPEGQRLLAQVQMNALNAHAHKLAIVGLKSRLHWSRFSRNSAGALRAAKKLRSFCPSRKSFVRPLRHIRAVDGDIRVPKKRAVQYSGLSCGRNSWPS